MPTTTRPVDDEVPARSAADAAEGTPVGDLARERNRQNVRRYRRRQADGLIILRLPVPEIDLVEALVADRLLDWTATDDRVAVERAVTELLSRYVVARRT